MLRLLRLWQPNSVMHALRDCMGRALWSLVRTVCVALLFLHVTACTFHWTAFRRIDGGAFIEPHGIPPADAPALAAATLGNSSRPPRGDDAPPVSMHALAGTETWLEQYQLQNEGNAVRC